MMYTMHNMWFSYRTYQFYVQSYLYIHTIHSLYAYYRLGRVTMEDLSEIKELFDAIDYDSNGYIDGNKLQRMSLLSDYDMGQNYEEQNGQNFDEGLHGTDDMDGYEDKGHNYDPFLHNNHHIEEEGVMNEAYNDIVPLSRSNSMSRRNSLSHYDHNNDNDNNNNTNNTYNSSDKDVLYQPNHRDPPPVPHTTAVDGNNHHELYTTTTDGHNYDGHSSTTDEKDEEGHNSDHHTFSFPALVSSLIYGIPPTHPTKHTTHNTNTNNTTTTTNKNINKRRSYRDHPAAMSQKEMPVSGSGLPFSTLSEQSPLLPPLPTTEDASVHPKHSLLKKTIRYQPLQGYTDYSTGITTGGGYTTFTHPRHHPFTTTNRNTRPPSRNHSHTDMQGLSGTGAASQVPVPLKLSRVVASLRQSRARAAGRRAVDAANVLRMPSPDITSQEDREDQPGSSDA